MSKPKLVKKPIKRRETKQKKEKEVSPKISKKAKEKEDYTRSLSDVVKSIIDTYKPDMADPDLLPCPSCGSPAGMKQNPLGFYTVSCTSRLWCLRTSLYEKKEQAYAIWNRRTRKDSK